MDQNRPDYFNGRFSQETLNAAYRVIEREIYMSAGELGDLAFEDPEDIENYFVAECPCCGERLDEDPDDTDGVCPHCGAEGEGAYWVNAEVMEWWIVSDWLYRKLTDAGETTATVYGVPLWGRCATGQAIELDGTIQRAVE